MFIKIFDSVYVNVYQIAQIMIHNSEEIPLEENDKKRNIYWYITLVMNNIDMTVENKEENKEINKNYSHFQNFIILDEEFDTIEEAQDHIKILFGNYLDSNFIKN